MSNDAQSEIAALKNQLFVQLIALIVISGTITAYLYRQSSVASKELQAIKPQADQLINAFGQNQAAVVQFVNEAVAYGEKHPDFKQLLLKNGIVAAPAAAPAVAPAAPAKK